jgi:sulfur-carrier protein
MHMTRILYFASLADAFGRSSEEVELPAEVGDVAGLLAWLRERGQPWAGLLTEGAVRVTVNKQFAEMRTPVADGDEIALVGMMR